MSRRIILWAVVVLIAAVGAIIFLVPMFQQLGDSDTEIAVAPEFGSLVSVENARLVMPPRAGQLASLRFDLSNRGNRSVQLVDVDIEHARVGMAEDKGPAPLPLANVNINSGETVSFGDSESPLVVAEYDEYVVPGAKLGVTLTFDNAETIAFTVPVVLENPHTSSEGPLN